MGLTVSPQNVTRGSLTAEQVAYCEDILTRHYGEPVRPVSRYCNALRQWAQALRDRAKRVEDMPEDERGRHEDSELTRIAEFASRIDLAISKSNLLFRLIYLDQPLRTEMCPVHKGRWSGCVWDEYCECMDGYDVTGWLPNLQLRMAELISRFAKSRGGFATWATHYPASSDYDANEPTTATALSKHARGRDVTESAERLAALLAEDGFVPEEWQP